MKRAPSATATPKASGATIEAVLKRIEGKLDDLAALLTANPHRHTVIHTGGYTGSLGMLSDLPGLLVGHAQIARFIRKSPSAVRRYARHMAFPAIRFGRHVVSHPTMICQWLWAVETQRRRQRGLTG